MPSCLLSALAVAVLAADPTTIGLPTTDLGPTARDIRFTTTPGEAGVAERFRLKPHNFRYTIRHKYDLKHSGVDVFDVRFPSPVASEYPANDTVYAELFVPKKSGPFPAVIVLDIMDGKQIVSRGQAVWLAQHDIAAMVVVLPYYGDRRPPPSAGRVRLVTQNVAQTVENVRQAVLDCRRATAVLAAQPGVDADRLGLVGTSLGSLIGAVVTAAEPRLTTACLLLGGGGLVDAYWDHPKAASVTPLLRFVGITRETVAAMLAPVDPLTYAEQLKGKRLLLIGASRDDVVPPVALRRLWAATGEPAIVWLDATHVGAAAYTFPVMDAVIAHIHGDVKRRPGPR